MAFGFFKKSETADTIFMGGKIFTQNTDFPWAEAVACKDGVIIAVGDYEDLTEFEGKHTEIVDLEGGTMLPGYIDTCGHPVIKAFKDSCLFLKEGNLEETLAQVSDYAAKAEGDRTIFAYGFNENILEGVEAAQTRASLDAISTELPIMVLGKSGMNCFVNTVAADAVKAAAEEDEVTTISLAYIMNILEPIDLDTMPESVPLSIGKYSQRGFTSVFDCGAPELFTNIYQNMMVHMFQENWIKQRFYGSLLVTRNVAPVPMIRRLSQFKTTCVELNGLVNFNTLKLVVDRTAEPYALSEEILRELCLEACDKGFDLHIDALGEDAVLEAIEVFAATRSAGYKKSSYTLAHDKSVHLEELTDSGIIQDIMESAPTYGRTDEDWLCIENAKSIENAIDMLTIDAAVQLGINSSFGSIENGKQADFVIFDQNPFEAADLEEFKKMKSAMTIIRGEIVYDANEDNIEEWHSALLDQEDSTL